MMLTHVVSMIIALSAVASDVAEPPKPAPVTDEVRIAQAYLLPNCPISNKAVGSMNDAATRTFDGRAVMVCCPPCFDRYERTPEKYKDKIDKYFYDIIIHMSDNYDHVNHINQSFKRYKLED